MKNIAIGAIAAAAGLVALAEIAAAQAPSSIAPSSTASVTLSINPQRVCVTGRAGAHPNLDLVIDNPAAAERKVEEIRALVRDSSSNLVERRLLWQQAVELLGRDRTLAAKSTTLIFNPFVFSQNLIGRTLTYELLLAGNPNPVSVTTRPEACANRYKMLLPVSGRTLVYDGFDILSHHRRGAYHDQWSREMGLTDNFQRFGIDLVMIDATGRYFTGDGSRTDQWLGWGKPVRAPAAGVVAAVHDGQPDNVVIGTIDKWTEQISPANPMSSYGNHVLIEHGLREFSLVGHLKNGSVKVRKGQRVAAGQLIGAIGNSGASGGVHVHFERRTGPGLARITTLPAYFTNLALVGAPAPAGAVAIDSGDVVIAR